MILLLNFFYLISHFVRCASIEYLLRQVYRDTRKNAIKTNKKNLASILIHVYLPVLYTHVHVFSLVWREGRKMVWKIIEFFIWLMKQLFYFCCFMFYYGHVLFLFWSMFFFVSLCVYVWMIYDDFYFILVYIESLEGVYVCVDWMYSKMFDSNR